VLNELLSFGRGIPVTASEACFPNAAFQAAPVSQPASLARRCFLAALKRLSVCSQAKRGTPCYMAPELFQDGSVHSSASDLWALGCVLYECAAGHPPFVDASFNQVTLAARRQSLDRP
jgi:serine/threonine protein kinase